MNSEAATLAYSAAIHRDRVSLALKGDRKVIVHRGTAEIHCYLVSVDSGSAVIVWTTASGRTRRGRVALEAITIPGISIPWQGVEQEEGLRGQARGAEGQITSERRFDVATFPGFFG